MVKMNISLGNQLVTKALSERVGTSETVRPLTSKFTNNSQNAQDNSKKPDDSRLFSTTATPLNRVKPSDLNPLFITGLVDAEGSFTISNNSTGRSSRRYLSD
jgi:hypothetical protein